MSKPPLAPKPRNPLAKRRDPHYGQYVVAGKPNSGKAAKPAPEAAARPRTRPVAPAVRVAATQLNIDARPALLDDLDNLSPKVVASLRAHAKTARAILFTGATGNGKTTTAQAVARELLTDENGVYDSRSLQEVNCATDGLVADIRRIVATADIPSLYGRRKVIIFDEIHKLLGAAQSALLTELEKPKVGGALYIGCTNQPNALMDTLKDRFIRYDTPVWTAEALATFAAKYATLYGIRPLSADQLRKMANPRQVLTALDGGSNIEDAVSEKGAMHMLGALLVGSHTNTAKYEQLTTSTLMAMGRYTRALLGISTWADGDVREQLTSLKRGYSSGQFTAADLTRIQYAIGMTLTAASAGNVPQIMLLDVLLAHALSAPVTADLVNITPSSKR